jgi:hypothetical protein
MCVTHPVPAAAVCCISHCRASAARLQCAGRVVSAWLTVRATLATSSWSCRSSMWVVILGGLCVFGVGGVFKNACKQGCGSLARFCEVALSAGLWQQGTVPCRLGL